MGIGWHNEQGTPNLRGRHVGQEPAYGPGTFGRHGMSLEPEVDFDWSSVEDRAGVLMEWMLAEKMPLTRPQAEGVVRFIDRTGAMSGGDQAALAIAALKWIADIHPEHSGGKATGTSAETKLGLRALAAIRVTLPGERVSLITQERTAKIFGVHRTTLTKLCASFRAYFRR